MTIWEIKLTENVQILQFYNNYNKPVINFTDFLLIYYKNCVDYFPIIYAIVTLSYRLTYPKRGMEL